MEKGTKILLSLMQLNIGGAETHVVELAKELKRKGYIPIVTSNGGVYVDELEAFGIKHYVVPLQNKNPLNVVKAKHLLEKIIKDEKIDIVHSHARIPSFILGILHKKMKFPFVTTAHWVFTTKYGLKYITNWGEKCVAVSDDIKNYLMDNYQIPSGDIQVTINGIDTDKFSPETDCSDIRAEFGIGKDDFVISYVSRMDESRSLAAKQLIDAVPKLSAEIPNLKVIIVGSGDDFENVKTLTEAANKKSGREVIKLAGGRTDINKFAGVCDLFVGVSRAALEAMAAEKAVVIAGNEGYIGLFDEDMLDVGIATNFCCRGCRESTSELIYEDIMKFFRMSGDEKQRLGEYGRELIKREYSVSRMAQDSITVYDWALAKNKEILVSGYYGFKNSGDDALLKAIIKDLKTHKESPNIVVLSANPKETEKMYRVKAINRLNVFKIAQHMKKAEMLVSGGGTLIQDGTSTKSLLYYLAVIKMALRKNVKVMLYSNGVGPLKRKSNIKITKKILNKVNLITLRDKESEETLKRIGVTVPETIVTADPVFGLDCAEETLGKKILAENGVPENKKILGVSVRKWADNCRGFEDAVAEACDYISEKYGFYVVFVPMQREKDIPISENIMRRMKSDAVIIRKRCSVEEITSVFKCLDLCIGMRLHSLIYSAAENVPLIGLAYDPKIVSFMEYMHQNLYIDVKKLDAKQLISMADKCINDYGEIAEELKIHCEYLKQQAERNGSLAVDLYERPM